MLTDELQKLRELAAACNGWSCDQSWPHPDDDGVAIVGSLTGDGFKYELFEIDTGNYDQPDDAIKLANFYASASPQVILDLLKQLENARAQALDEAASIPFMMSARPEFGLEFHDKMLIQASNAIRALKEQGHDKPSEAKP